MNDSILFVGIMYSNKKIYEEAVKELIKKFGNIEQESFTYDFNFTNYYKKEMGKDLVKKFLVFKNLIDKKDLVDVKIITAKIENKFRINGKRRINIDPGYLSKKKLILASSKESAYRENLGRGVYKHLTLKFKNGKCETFHRTFPDFREKKVQDFFLELVNKKL